MKREAIAESSAIKFFQTAIIKAADYQILSDISCNTHSFLLAHKIFKHLTVEHSTFISN